ncbi:hypothetical protein NKH77_46975 [Streptomyces sp. M19]
MLAASRVERAADGGRHFDAEALWRGVVEALGRLDCRRRPPRALAIAAHIGTVAVDAGLRPVDDGGGWSDPRGLDALRALPEDLTGPLLRTAGRPALSGARSPTR